MPSFRIGRIAGIPIKIGLSFLLVLPLFAWLIAADVGRWTSIMNDVVGARSEERRVGKECS